MKQRCLVCGGLEHKFYGEKGFVRLLICKKCGFGFASRDVWKDPYVEVDYYERNQVGLQYPISYSRTDLDRLKILGKYLKPGSKILDYGGGTGTTAVAARALGYNVTVIDSSRMAIENGKKFHPEIEWILANTIPEYLPANSFHAITMFHVLEHILTPDELILKVNNLLKPSGFLLIEVPNFDSYMRKIMKMNWVYILDHHVNYFGTKNLKYYIEKFGFRLLRTEFRRTFAINEKHPWKEPLKRILCILGFADIVRCFFVKL